MLPRAPRNWRVAIDNSINGGNFNYRMQQDSNKLYRSDTNTNSYM